MCSSWKNEGQGHTAQSTNETHEIVQVACPQIGNRSKTYHQQESEASHVGIRLVGLSDSLDSLDSSNHDSSPCPAAPFFGMPAYACMFTVTHEDDPQTMLLSTHSVCITFVFFFDFNGSFSEGSEYQHNLLRIYMDRISKPKNRCTSLLQSTITRWTGVSSLKPSESMACYSCLFWPISATWEDRRSSQRKRPR